MKTIIAGGRHFDDWELLKRSCDTAVITEVVSGGATGADILGELYAQVNQLPIKRFPANWDQYGRSAGPIRNREMAQYAEQLIAFWDGKSRGTKNMIEVASELGLIVKVVRY